jgi:hypothetical protein
MRSYVGVSGCVMRRGQRIDSAGRGSARQSEKLASDRRAAQDSRVKKRGPCRSAKRIDEIATGRRSRNVNSGEAGGRGSASAIL